MDSLLRLKVIWIISRCKKNTFQSELAVCVHHRCLVKGSQYDHLVQRYSNYAPTTSAIGGSKMFAVGLRCQVSKVGVLTDAFNACGKS